MVPIRRSTKGCERGAYGTLLIFFDVEDAQVRLPAVELEQPIMV
jgi:hypothetical protein